MNRHCLWLASLLVLACCSKANVPADVLDPIQEDDPWLFKDLLPEFRLADGEPASIGADFGGTRSQIDVNEAQTYAGTVWTKGDSFRMYGVSGNSRQIAQYTTSESGPSVSFSTRHSISYSGPYYAVYPTSTKFGYADDGRLLLGVNLPSEQTTVAGNIQDGLAIAYTQTSSQTAHLHFQSQVSLVRFQMTGDVLSRVKQVTIKGTSPLSGDAILVIENDGSSTLTQNRSFEGDEQFNSVTLSGDFVAGQYYYFVLYPGTQSSFQMVFSDGSGHSTTKIAPQFTFPRARISDFGTIDLGSEFTDDYVDTTPIRYMTADPNVAPKPVTIAVIPEGFTAAEMSTYEMYAKSGIDALMNTEPFKSYKDYFNVWLLKVPSRESGANVTDGNGNITKPVDCYFGSKWGNGVYDDMVANESIVYDYVTRNCPDILDKTHTIKEVPILMIINDKRYGGICHYYSDGRGYCMAPITEGVLHWRYADKGVEAASATAEPENVRNVTDAERREMGINDGNWLNTLVHEFGGHCFSRLADEYWYLSYSSPTSAIDSHTWPVPFGLNISATYDNPGWKDELLGEDLNVKSSLLEKDSRYGRIGVFQGGAVSVFNRWRSEKISCMIDNRFYFSTWQRIIIVNRIMTLSENTFDMSSFWAKDDPTDPLRDAGSSAVYGKEPLPVREVPMLPPPVLHED